MAVIIERNKMEETLEKNNRKAKKEKKRDWYTRRVAGIKKDT